MQALYDGDANNIKAWWLKCPRNQITTLDTHDGLGVVDVADLMSQEQIDRTKNNIFSKGANANMRFNTKEYGNLDIYQVRYVPLHRTIRYLLGLSGARMQHQGVRQPRHLPGARGGPQLGTPR